MTPLASQQSHNAFGMVRKTFVSFGYHTKPTTANLQCGSMTPQWTVRPSVPTVPLVWYSATRSCLVSFCSHYEPENVSCLSTHIYSESEYLILLKGQYEWMAAQHVETGYSKRFNWCFGHIRFLFFSLPMCCGNWLTQRVKLFLTVSVILGFSASLC